MIEDKEIPDNRECKACNKKLTEHSAFSDDHTYEPKDKEGIMTSNNFNHPLCQNNKDWHGYTVFTLKFNDIPIRFVTEKDAELIVQTLKKERDEHFVRKDMIERIMSKLRTICKDWKPNNEKEEFGLKNYIKALDDFEEGLKGEK